MLSSEQKHKIDKAGEDELWQLLAAPCADSSEATYIRERLRHKAQMETRQTLEKLDRRLREVEHGMNRSQLGAPTFWLAAMAAVFASFSVPWDLVEEKGLAWGRRIFKATESSPNSSFSTETAYRRRQDVAPEPKLPEDSSSPLADALILLPRFNVSPQSL